MENVAQMILRLTMDHQRKCIKSNKGMRDTSVCNSLTIKHGDLKFVQLL